MLGLAQAAAPVGAWIAVTNRWSWAALALGLAVGLWIGGFDIIYALQDIEVDRANGLHSIPARFGPRVALAVSAGSHVVTVGLLCAFGVLEGFGTIWYVGIIVVSAALGYEHAIVRPNDMSRVNRAFFTTNGFVGIALFAFGLADMAHRGLSG
jgi:4-hydroxybenzoate polyprenyltransferase